MSETEWTVRPNADGAVGVVSAVCQVMAELPSIGKTDKSPEGYQYRGIEAITQHLQPLMARHGLLMVPQAEVLATTPSPAMKEGWQDVLVRVEWLIAASDGSSLTAVTTGIGRDRSDKGANKGQTQAMKYLLLALFMIADRKDDADGHTYEDGRVQGTLPPGHVWAKDGKASVLAAVEGDKALAQQAWQQAGLDGLHHVSPAELEAALTVADRLMERLAEGVAEAEQEAAAAEVTQAELPPAREAVHEAATAMGEGR